MAAVTLFVILMIPSEPRPIQWSISMPSIEECLEEAGIFLKQAGTRPAGTIQAGCYLEPSPSQETAQ